VDAARISAEGMVVATPVGAPSLATSLPGAVQVSRRGGSFILKTDTLERTLVAPSIELRPSREGPMRLGGVAHSGWFLLLSRPDVSPGAFDVVEFVALEKYLPGVVAAELYPHWSPAAYEAQAIAARSYALHERSRRRAAEDPFDLENTAGADQAYSGADSSAAARRAVEKTRGQALTWQGTVLRAYYSSCCGGRPGSARDTWPTSSGFEFNLAAPLQAAPREHACHGSPNYAWTVTGARADLAPRLSAWGAENGHAIKDLKSVKSITVARRNAAQRPAEFDVTDADGRVFRIQADALRHAANSAAKAGGKTLPAPENGERLRSGDVEPMVEGSVVVFAGRGFGHGVGLCQFGAEGFAMRGWSASKILALFYPGAAVTQLY
jgi:stage II sporulation protein D